MLIDVSNDPLEAVWDDGEFVVSRATQTAGRGAMLVVTPVRAQPAPASLAQLEHAYRLRGELESSWAARPIELIRHRGQLALVIEHPDGELLAPLIGRNWDVPAFLRVAIGLAQSLARLHQRGLVHKDVKPSNILANDVTGHVWLTGFGITSFRVGGRQAPEPPDVIAGTLAYMAPEQTGRMNRSVDARSDLYACGVTLYEMLTGELPFSASGAMEWSHRHVARSPTPPHERADGIPPAISTIVMKLLSKDAEDRYQTALGLEADLRRCLTEWESRGRIEPFPLGTHDVPDRLLIPDTLYGREHEIETLVAAFDRVVAEGASEFVLVSGYSGAGKSSVVNELRALVARRGLFASGKFEQYKRDIPYGTLADALQSLVRRILSESDLDLARWRDAIRHAVGPNGQLIVDLIPDVELVIGAQPPIADLSPPDTQARFQIVLERFIGVFARPEQPLALFLDDLQWLDAATLAFLAHLAAATDVKHLLLIGAYRDNEVGPSHPLRRTLEAISSAGARVREIVLAPLALNHVVRLVADALHCNPERAIPLAKLVHQRTAGNPFFTIQFLTALADEGLLAFDLDAAAWMWDVTRIGAKGYTDDVVDLIVGKLSRLSPLTQEALKLFACLGNRAEIFTLSVVYATSEEEVHWNLWEPCRLQLVVRVEGSYAFVHDRVQEAAYTLIPEELRADAHLRIGRRLIAHTPPEKREDAIFEIVNQFNLGAAAITSRDEQDELAELNLIAGKRAMAATAYASALTYLVAGANLVGDDCWQRRHALIFGLEFHRAECEFLTGELAAAEERLTMLSARAAGTVEHANSACVRIDLYTTLNQPDRAIAVGLAHLRRVGIEWSAHPTEEEARREYERIWSQLGGRAIEELIELPLMSDPASLATLDVLTKVLVPAMCTDANLLSLVICGAVNLSLERGNSDGSCVAYGWLGQIAGPYFGNYKAGFSFGWLGYELVEQRGLKRFQAYAYATFGTVVMRTKHIHAAQGLVRRAFEVANKTGDLTCAAYCCNILNTNLLAAGDPLPDVQREAENGFAFAQKARFGLVIDIITAQLGLIRTLRGLTPTFGSFNDERFDEPSFERRLAGDTSECWYWIRKLQARFFAGDFASAIDAASKAKRLLWTSPSLFETAEYEFYAALSRAASSESAFPDGHRQHLEALVAHHRQIEIWAENCPENFESRAALVSAEVARIEGRELDAERLYEQAIRLARTNGFIQNEGLANELAARFYAARGFETIAHAYLRHARYCYLRWGADGKVRQLDQSHPSLREDTAAHGPTATIAASVEHMDLGTIVKMSQTISGEIVLETLVHTLLVMTMEHAGAERGVLILPDGDGQRVAAEATTAEKGIAVRFIGEPPAPSTLPGSILTYVFRTRQDVVLDDASVENRYSADDYIARGHVRSVLCLPLIKQGRLTGVLYLENNLATHVFTPARIAVLKLLASQAATSLENAHLHADLRGSENRLRQAIDTIPAIVGRMDGCTIEFFNKRWYEYFGKTSEGSTEAQWMAVVHPDDVPRMLESWSVAQSRGEPYETEYRMRRADGVYRWFLHRALPLRDEQGAIVKWYVVAHDIDDQRRAEETVRQDERELRLLVDFIPHMIFTLGLDRRPLYINRAGLEYTGLRREDILARKEIRPDIIHAEDFDAVQATVRRALSQDVSCEVEARVRRHDGVYRWFWLRYEPLRGELGEIVRWYGTGVDIDDRKRSEERVRGENLALREQVAQASMFEEIVGASAPLRALLSQVSRVAPTDSTVLITGETGTGKELVARAIHKRSSRAARAFISLNCAVIPSTLIASELFGHEKGAFTGAVQRRLGRFELADGGTIFLDEIGELPVETQVALLRVLQEQAFERVGGTDVIRVDVRVIVATNRDLSAAIAAGSFRRDLFYRLNVFPLEMPPLRARTDDIPMLVEYFIDRYSSKAGKRIRGADQTTLELLRSYAWPGNIRELQNVIERAVILCDTDTLSVDESWLPRSPAGGATPDSRLTDAVQAHERALIEAALAACKGRVSGRQGAAARLGMPASTLDAKIRALKINKHQYKEL